MLPFKCWNVVCHETVSGSGLGEPAYVLLRSLAARSTSALRSLLAVHSIVARLDHASAFAGMKADKEQNRFPRSHET